MKSKLIFFIFCCCFELTTLSAQDYMFSPVTIENGLSQSTVNAIVQDHKGFIWIGTQDGLNRFDGHEFKVYKKDPFDSTSITDNYISSLFVDDADNLWVGTMNGGLNLIDASREYILHFQHIRNDTTSLTDDRIEFIYQDQRKRIWIGTSKGFNEVVIGEDQKISFRYHRFLNFDRGKTSGLLHAMQDRKGRWWITTQDGLHCCRLNEEGYFSEEKDTLVQWLKAESNQRRTYRIIQPCEDRQGHLWMSSARGLISYDPESREIVEHPLNNKNADSHMERVISIKMDQSGHLLALTNAAIYLNKYEQENYQTNFSLLQPGGEVEYVYLRDPTCLLTDQLHEGLYWIGTGLSGLLRVHRRRKKFITQRFPDLQRSKSVTPSVFQISQDTSGILWLGMPAGLVRYDRHSGEYQLFEDVQIGRHRIRTGTFNELYHDQEGNFWAGSYTGLLKIKPERTSDLQADHFLQGFECESPAVFAIYEEEDALYLGVFGGINFLDKKTQTILPCPIALDTLNNSGINYIVSSFLRDRQNNFWITTSKGLLFYRNLQGSLRDNLDRKPEYYKHDQQNRVSLIDDHINDVHEDGKGNIWLATMNGLVKAAPTEEGMVFENYREANGLINNVVYGILEDLNNNCLWLSTNNGLCRFDPDANRFYGFDLGDGLQSKEFNANAFYQNKAGELFFGGINGLTHFSPEQIQLEKNAPPVYLTELETAAGLTYNLLGTDKTPFFKLPYDQNSFTLRFTGLDFISPSGIKYYYDLEGTSTQNVPIGSSRQLNFNSLAPGEYKVGISAVNKDGFVNHFGASIGMVISAPFWQKGWFHLLIGLFALLSISGLYYLIYRIKMRRLAEIDDVRKLAAQDFHDELGSKLTIISMYSELTRNQLNGAKNEVKTYLGKVTDTSNSLYDSMKDLLWALNPEQDTINDLFFHLKDFGEELFSHSGVVFQSQGLNVELGNQLLPIPFKRHLLLIFKEAMNNSLKHANAVNVKLKMSNVRGVLTVEVADDGLGFNCSEGNNGEGLRNMQSRARKIAAKLFIRSAKQGTIVKLICPLALAR